MNFASIRIITENVKMLAEFYEKVTAIAPRFYTEDFCELRTENFAIAIGSTKTVQLFGHKDIAKPAANRTVIIEFRVPDVDAEYNKVCAIENVDIVQEPTTMPWGNRSLLFRDPDGNLVNFFTPATQDAAKRQAQ